MWLIFHNTLILTPPPAHFCQTKNINLILIFLANTQQTQILYLHSAFHTRAKLYFFRAFAAEKHGLFVPKSFRRNRSEEPQGDGAVGKNITERYSTQNSPSHNRLIFSYQKLGHQIRELQYTGFLLEL